MNALLERCDALDGNADGLIFNRSACDFDPKVLSCSARPDAQCLADDKAAALASAMAGDLALGNTATQYNLSSYIQVAA